MTRGRYSTTFDREGSRKTEERGRKYKNTPRNRRMKLRNKGMRKMVARERARWGGGSERLWNETTALRDMKQQQK